MPEFVRPQDGHDKQGCENAAAKRWLTQHGERLSRLKVTVLAAILILIPGVRPEPIERYNPTL